MGKWNLLRRTFIKKLFITLAGIHFLHSSVFAKKSCRTAPDAEGPFYRRNAPHRDSLATSISKSDHRLQVTGTVYKADCTEIIPGVEVDVWHASPKGEYDNNSLQYQFRGKITTNKEGRYSFDTLLPGFYGSRPRHIHFKIRKKNYAELTTQLYFVGDKFLENDVTARKSSGSDRAMPLKKYRDGHFEVTFDIYLTD